MNAIQFIKEHGVEKAREVVSGAPDGATHLSDDACHYVNADFKPLPARIKEQLLKLIVLDDLKHVVESVDHFVDINDMVDCEILDHPEDYTSPNCKKYDKGVK